MRVVHDGYFRSSYKFPSSLRGSAGLLHFLMNDRASHPPLVDLLVEDLLGDEDRVDVIAICIVLAFSHHPRRYGIVLYGMDGSITLRVSRGVPASRVFRQHSRRCGVRMRTGAQPGSQMRIVRLILDLVMPWTKFTRLLTSSLILFIPATESPSV